MMIAELNIRQVFPIFLMLCSMSVHGQMNLAISASASADTSHVDYPAAGAIDRDTTDGAGWGVSAIDTLNQSEINLALSATASADDSSGPPSEAIDGDTTDWTGWSVTASFDVVPHWLELTWESAQSVNRVVLFTNSAGDGAYALRGYSIQYWDGAAYQDIDTVSGNRDARVSSTFPSVTTTKIRIYCEEPDSASLWYRISELEVYTDVKIDSHWLNLTWVAPVSVNRIVLFTNSSENGAYALRGYDIQYWDGAVYQTIASVGGNNDPKVTSSFPTVTTTKIRIFCKDPDGASQWYRISEVEVYNDAQTAIENKAPEISHDVFMVHRDASTLETVVVAQEEIHQIQVYSMSGILVYQNLKSAGTLIYRISSDALAPGAYVVMVNRLNSKKFVIW